MDVYREGTPVCRGDVVHLEGQSDSGSWLMDREKGFLVLRPDSLISGTSISSSIRCMRRAVLGEMFKVRKSHLILPTWPSTFCVATDKSLLDLQFHSLLCLFSCSPECCRDGFLLFVMQSFDGGSKQMLNGTMVHDVFQKAATAKDFSSETLSRLADQALHSPQYLPDM